MAAKCVAALGTEKKRAHYESNEEGRPLSAPLSLSMETPLRAVVVCSSRSQSVLFSCIAIVRAHSVIVAAFSQRGERERERERESLPLLCLVQPPKIVMVRTAPKKASLFQTRNPQPTVAYPFRWRLS